MTPTGLPSAYPVTRYRDIWQNSPFELEAAPAVSKAAKKSFASDYALIAMMKQGSETIVYLMNRKTGATQRVSNQEKEGEFELVRIYKDAESVRDIEVGIRKGEEEARFTYDDQVALASAGNAANRTSRQQQVSSNRAGQAGVNAGNANNANRGGGSSPLNIPSPREKPEPADQKLSPNTVETADNSNTSDPDEASRRRIVVPNARPRQ